MRKWQTLTVQQLIEADALERPMDGNHGSIHPKTADFVDAGIPFVMASDLKNGRVDLETCAFISEKQARGLAKGFCLPGDVLLSHKATIGRTAIVQENAYPFIMLTPQVTYYRIKNKKLLNNRFLKYYFDSKEFQGLFGAWAGGGSTRAYLGITAQKKLPIPIPPIETQLAITQVVAPLDDKIDLNRQMNKTLEKMARAIFKDWFIDFGPTRAKIEGCKPYLSPEMWALFPYRLDNESKPDGWKTTPFSETIQIIGGGTPKTAVDAYWNGDIPWFSVVDAPIPGQIWVVDTEKYISDEGLRASSARLLPVGTTIISARGTVGRIALVGVPMAMNQSCYGLSSRVGSAAFTYLSTQAVVNDLQQKAHGSVFDTITRDTFSGISILIPPEEIVQAFDACVRLSLGRSLHNNLENSNLAATRDLLLPKLMSGEIRIRDAEKVAEAVL